VAEQQKLRDDVPRLGLQAEIKGRSVQDWAKDVLAIARGGLARRKRLDSSGNDETGFLTPLEAIARSGKTQAQELLEAFEGRWNGSVDPIYEEMRY
jgi:glutamate--cysteine ligase